MATTTYGDIKDSLTQLYLDDPRPWLVGPDYFGIFDFSGGKDSPDPSGLASLIFEAVLSVSSEQRDKPVTVLCTDTRVEIPAIAK